MELAWPWLPPVLLGGAAIAVLVTLLLSLLAGRRLGRRRTLRVANTRGLQDGRRFRGASREYRFLLGAASVTALVALGACAITVSRIVESTTITPETRNRDLVLCLDVSGSMTSFDADLLASFDDLIAKFEGERIGLVLFDSSPLQVFPLTADYPFIREQVSRVAAGLNHESDGYAYRDGTRGGGGSSRIGDGVAGCVLQFDLPDLERSRTVVVATDNREVGESILSLAQARTVAVARDIQLYGINPGHRADRSESGAFRREMEATGGGYYPVTSADQSRAAVTGIVETVTRDPATVVTESPIRTTTDRPDPAIWLLTALTLTLFLLVWRLRL